MKTETEIMAKIKELESDKDKFQQFLMDTYGDKQCSHKIDVHTWRIRREIEILEWILDRGMPF